MFIDARKVPTGTVLRSDLCIVGAGTAGITLARQFIGSGMEVCLLESGGFAFDREIQSLAQGDNIGLRYADLETCQLRYFGGNTNAWGGWFRPLEEIDFQRRPWVEDSGWPFPYAELLPYYEAAHAFCQVASTDYDVRRAVEALGDPRAQLLPFDRAKLETALHRFSPPTRFGQVYREAFHKADTVKCFTHAHVLGIRTTDDAQSATRIAVGCLSGGRFEVTARMFVLAAGAIENARLLLLSNDVMANGLGNQHDLVGRYFMDHPHMQRVLIPDSSRPALGLYGVSFRKRGISARLSLPVAIQEREELLNYGANIYPVYPGHASRGWQSFRKLILSLDPRRHGDPFTRFALPFERSGVSIEQLWDIVRQIDKVAVAAFLQRQKPDRLISSFILESKPEQAPNRDSRITLQGRRDAFGRNLVHLDWRLLPIDRRTVVRAEEIIDGELRRLGIGHLAPPVSEREDWPAAIAGGWHQMGTTRAHPDPKQGVVDAQGRVHGLSNLFITGASVFPTGGTASPTPTIVALALRLADHLKRSFADHARV